MPETVNGYGSSFPGRYGKLGGGFKHFLFSPRSLGKWSNLTSIFLRWVVQPPTRFNSTSPLVMGKSAFRPSKVRDMFPRMYSKCLKGLAQINPVVGLERCLRRLLRGTGGQGDGWWSPGHPNGQRHSHHGAQGWSKTGGGWWLGRWWWNRSEHDSDVNIWRYDFRLFWCWRIPDDRCHILFIAVKEGNS